MSLLRLLQLCDPALPIGGFSHSSALETYVQKGVVTDKNSALEYITAMLTLSLKHTDAAVMSLAFDAASTNDFARLYALDEECSAVKPASEMRLASEKLGKRLLKIFGKYGPTGLPRFNYPVVFGHLATVFEISKRDALQGFLYNAVAAYVTNAVKLIPLGQQEGQEILFSLNSLISEVAEQCMNPDPDMIGFTCAGFDIRSMEHERLYSRLYMS